MDKEFEEWHSKTYHPDYGREHKEWEEKAWNASKQHWLDEAIKISEKHKKEHYQDRGWLDDLADDIAEEVKELKNETSI